MKVVVRGICVSTDGQQINDLGKVQAIIGRGYTIKENEYNKEHDELPGENDIIK